MGDNIKEKLAASHCEGAQGHMFLKKKPHTLGIDFLCFHIFFHVKIVNKGLIINSFT